MVETMWSLLHFPWPTSKFPLESKHKPSFIMKSQGLDILFCIIMRASSHPEKGQ